MTALAEEKVSAGEGQDSSRAFSLKIVIGMLVVGVVSFAAFIALSAFADDLRQPEDGAEHGLSKSAIGFAGFVDLLRAEGYNVRVSRGALHELRNVNQLVILSPRAGQAVTQDMYQPWGSVLIVLPKWDTWFHWETRGWVWLDGIRSASSVEDVLRTDDFPMVLGRAEKERKLVLTPEDGGAAADAGSIKRLQTVVGAYIEPVLQDGNGHTVLGRIDMERGYQPPDSDEFELEAEIPPPAAIPEPPAVEPEADADRGPVGIAQPEEYLPPNAKYPYQRGRDVYILSEPDLMNTQGIASAQGAWAGLQVIRKIANKDTEIVFDMSLHGVERARNFMRLLLAPPFLPAVLCLVFAGILMMLYALAGRMRVRSGRELALGKATLVENSALLLSLAGRDPGMGKRYAAMTRVLAAQAVGVPTRTGEAQKVAMLDAVNAGEGRFSEIAGELDKAETPSGMLKAASRLFRWRQEIGREHRRR
jgi:hypothetical protein